MVKEKKKMISMRVGTATYKSIGLLCKNTGLSMTELVELSLVGMINRFNGTLDYKGVDLKEYGKLKELRLLRDMIGFKRNEFLSKQLLIKRIRQDILKLILFEKRDKRTLEIVSDYLDIREKESSFYNEPIEIKKEIAKIRKQMTEKGIADMKRYVEQDAVNQRFLTGKKNAKKT